MMSLTETFHGYCEFLTTIGVPLNLRPPAPAEEMEMLTERPGGTIPPELAEW
jgi:hypothetical protein